jgi:putative aldouronate transport system substrate-binding protein
MKSIKMQKVLAIAIAALTVLSVTACSSTKPSASSPSASTAAPKDPMAKYTPTITVTSVKNVSDSMQQVIDKQSDVMNNNIWETSYESELGIKINYVWSAPATQYDTKLNTQIAANDLPNIIPCNATQLKMLVDNGVATDLTKAFKDYATSFTNEMMKDDNNVSINQATVGGKLMALPSVAGNLDNSNMWWIRKDWLASLGLSAPKTMADVINIAKAFASKDPDKDGKADTYGLGLNKDLCTDSTGSLDAFFEGYHAYYGGWLKDSSGKLVAGTIQPEVKTALTALADLYKSGAIDQEFAVKDASKLSEDIIAGKVGMFSGQHWQAFYPLQDSKNKNPKADWAVYPIVSSDNKTAVTMLNGSAGVFYAINKSMKNPEAAVKLYNYYYEKDPALSPNFDPKYHGVNGEQLTKPGQNYIWAAIGTFYPMQNLFISQQVNKYITTKDESILKNGWISDNYSQIQKYQSGDNTYYSTWMWSGPNGSENVINTYQQNKQFLQNAYIGANTDSMTQYQATLDQLRLTTFTKIIMGSSPISAFDDYVSQWHKLGGDSITTEVNAAK